MFGKRSASSDNVDVPVVEAVGKVTERRRLSARVYRTTAGYRVLIADRLFAAKGTGTEKLLGEFGADPFYVRLCRMQESFRAGSPPNRGGSVSANRDANRPSPI